MSIATDTYCIECQLRRNLELVRKLGDEEKATRFAREWMAMVLRMPEDVPSPCYGPETTELLHRMYDYLCTHGDCYYIEYCGTLVGDISLRDSGEIAIVVCKEYQNRHIGRRCVLGLLKLAKEKGMAQVTANIYAFNTQSQRMFRSVGFAQTDKEWYAYTF